VFSNYSINLPAGATVKGIEVRLDAKADSTAGTPKLCVALSSNGGATWTAFKTSATLTTTEVPYLMGGATDLWGAAWAAGNFTNTNFRVKVVSISSDINRDFSLDWVAVNVWYAP
jgi:hypothetical protein